MLMKMSIMSSIILPFLKHPISMGFMLINQTTLMSMLMMKESKTSWYSYILFLTMIGGIMIMFMYMSSIASNEKFNLMPMKLMLMFTIIMMATLILKDQPMEKFQLMEMEKMNMNKMQEMKSTSKFFNLNKMVMTVTMMNILFLTMISVTNISNTFEGPLKKK